MPDIGHCAIPFNGNVRLQFIDKLTPAFSAFRCVGAVDAVSEFRYGHHGDNDWRIADFGSTDSIMRIVLMSWIIACWRVHCLPRPRRRVWRRRQKSPT